MSGTSRRCSIDRVLGGRQSRGHARRQDTCISGTRRQANCCTKSACSAAGMTMKFSRDGKMLVVPGYGHWMSIFSVETGKKIHSLPVSERVVSRGFFARRQDPGRREQRHHGFIVNRRRPGHSALGPRESPGPAREVPGPGDRFRDLFARRQDVGLGLSSGKRSASWTEPPARICVQPRAIAEPSSLLSIFPTANASFRQARTAPFASGTPRRANLSAFCTATLAKSLGWPSSRTASCWRLAVGMAPSVSGTSNAARAWPS